jgi:hypothetical protein
LRKVADEHPTTDGGEEADEEGSSGSESEAPV